ncbi:MAG: CotH kinase family protein [Clostridiales bacterium]|nr:CotH kinase family protein [Clostridiales bacterium]MDY3764471.1 CotH kinase family protein [Candidatus Ventricola sp.]
MKRFARLRLLLGMAALLGAAAAAVLLASPYAPVVEPCRDIEDIWAIEDAREESDTPLVTALDNNGQALGYDAASNTFYCTLGLGHEEDWPQLHLTAPGANGVSLCFVDDYTYDWCADAIRDGWAYQILAYTDDAYSYASLVFTGLPIISLETQEALRPHEDIPVRVSVSAAGEAGLTACGRAHERGDTSLRMRPKHGIKVEFTRHADGTRKTEQEMPLLGRTDEFILIACSMDYLLIRDKLSWDLWNGISSEDEAFGPRETAYCEVFAGDAYLGVYVMMKPYDYAQELARLGADAPAADSLYRLAGRSVHEFDKPLIQDHRGMYYEQHYAPSGETGHAALLPYLALFAEEDDAVFNEKALELLDIDSVIRYALFVQACGMTDNEHNNLYIVAHRTEDGYRYLFAPWDLDVSWGRDDDENAEVWYDFPIFDRLVELDCGGVVRDRLAAIWQQMRENGFSGENVGSLLDGYNAALNDSGAFYRDAERWNRPNAYSENYNIYSYAAARFEMMDRRIAEMTSEALRGRRLRIQGYTTFDEGPLSYE